MDNLQRDNGSMHTTAKNIDRAASRTPPMMVSDAPMTQAHVRVPDSVDRTEWLKLRSRRRSDRRRASSASSTHPTLGATPPSHGRKMSMDSTTSSLATETSLRSAMSTPLHRGQNDERVRRSVTFAVGDHDRRRRSLDSESRRRTASSAVRKIFPSSSSSSSLASSQQQQCGVCRAEFTRYRRPHRCRACGKVVCATCSPARLPKRTCKPCAGDLAIPRVFPVVSPARERVSPHALGEETTSATRASRRCVGAPEMAGVPADTGVVVMAVAHEAAVVGVGRAEEVGKAGTEEGSSYLDVARNGRLGGSVSEERVGKGRPENPRSLGGEGALGVDSVGESEPVGASSLTDTSQGGEVWLSNGVSVAVDQHVEHLDNLDGPNSNMDGCRSTTRGEFDTNLSPTASLRNDYPRPVAGSKAAVPFPPDSAAAGLDGLPTPSATPVLNASTVATAGTGARQAGVVVDGGSKPRDERTVLPASGEEVKPEEEEEEDRVSIATRNEEGSAVRDVEDEPEVRPAPLPDSLLHPPPAAASLATGPRCGLAHLPLEPIEATQETPPPSVEFEGGTEIVRVPDTDTREEGGGVVFTPLRHRGPVEEDSQVKAKREEDEEKKEEEEVAEEVEEEVKEEVKEEVEEKEGGGRGQGEKEEGAGGGVEEEVLEDVSGQRHETNGAVETMQGGLRFTMGRVDDEPEGGTDVSGAAARLGAEKRRGEEVTDLVPFVPLVLPKNEEGEGEVAEGDCAEGLRVEREEGECDREALVLGAGVAVDGRVNEELVEKNSGSMGPLFTAVVPQGKPQQQQQEQQQEEDGEGEKEVVEEEGNEVEEEETETETETVLVLGTGMGVDDHAKEEPVDEGSEPMGPLDGHVKEEQEPEDDQPMHSLVSATVPQGQQRQQEEQQQEEEQEKGGEKEVEEEVVEVEEKEEEEEGRGEEEEDEQEGGVDEEGASVDGEDFAVGDSTPAATIAGTITDSPVNDKVARQKTSGLPVALPISHGGVGGTDNENFGEDGVEEGEEASTVGVGDATAGPGNATDSFSQTALVSAGEGGTAEDAVEGEGSCSHEAGTMALDTAIESITQAPDCKKGAAQDDDVGEKAAAAEVEGACNYEKGSDALGLLVDAAGSTQHEQEERKPQEAQENPVPSCGTAAGTASENNGLGDTIAAGSGGVEGATVDAPTVRSDSEALDSRSGGSACEASGGYADGGRNMSSWLAALKELVEKGGSCCH